MNANRKGKDVVDTMRRTRQKNGYLHRTAARQIALCVFIGL
jgi:hypothetical protein